MNIKIYQIFFDELQSSELCQEFVPYFNSKKSRFYEFEVMYDFFKKGVHRECDYFGVSSWKFQSKSEITGKQFINFVNENPGYDSYFINPHPEQTFYYPNIWIQGDTAHPGLIEITEEIFNKLGYNIDLRSLNITKKRICYANYWIGSEKFWDGYMAFVLPVYDLIMKDKDVSKKVSAYTSYHYKAEFIPFIMERLYSTYITMHNFSVKSYNYPLSIKLRKYIKYFRNEKYHIAKTQKGLIAFWFRMILKK